MISKLIENEELLSDLYEQYSNMLPDDSEFWMQIAKDETVHASWVTELSEKVKQGLVQVDDSRFKDPAIENFGRWLLENIQKAKSEVISPIQALSISMDLENSMLERGIFEAYDSDDPELRTVLEKLKKSTEIHYAEVKARWNEERSSSST